MTTWSSAFAQQAKSDLDARESLLQKQQLPRCHELHFLQMACEKVCKAHLMTRSGADPLSLQKSHAYVAKNLPVIAKQYNFDLTLLYEKAGVTVLKLLRVAAERLSSSPAHPS